MQRRCTSKHVHHHCLALSLTAELTQHPASALAAVAELTRCTADVRYHRGAVAVCILQSSACGMRIL
jgi:hypothetical protein